MTDQLLPKGIWYEEAKNRFRVRKYRNGISYLKGYYRTYGEAEQALAELEAYLDTIPKQRKKRESSPAPDPSLSGHAKSIRQRQQEADNIRS